MFTSLTYLFVNETETHICWTSVVFKAKDWKRTVDKRSVCPSSLSKTHLCPETLALYLSVTCLLAYLTATRRPLPYGIIQCYLPLDTGERAPPNPSQPIRLVLDLPTLEGWKAEFTSDGRPQYPCMWSCRIASVVYGRWDAWWSHVSLRLEVWNTVIH